MNECNYLENIIKPLVTCPDEVEVKKIIDDRGVLLTLKVNPKDIPTVIGKEGKFAQAIRIILRTYGSRQEALIHFKILLDAPSEHRPMRVA